MGRDDFDIEEREEEIKVELMEKWANGKKVPPFELQFPMTYNCNLFCKFCLIGQRRCTHQERKEYSEISGEKWLKIVEQAGEMGVKKIDIAGGGEPFFSENPIEVLKKIKSEGIFGTLITNGTLLKEQDLRTLVDVEYDSIGFSIDSPYAKGHDYIRGGKGIFKRAVDSIKTLKHYKNETGKRRPRITINTVLTNKNYKDIEGMLRLTKELGADGLQLYSLHDAYDFPHLKLSDSQSAHFRDKIDGLTSLAEELNIGHNLEDFKEEDVIEKASDMEEVILKDFSGERKGIIEAPCFLPWLHMEINARGFLGVCPGSTEKFESRIGERTLKDVWENDGYINKFRRRILEGNLPKLCSECCTPVYGSNKRLKGMLKEKMQSK